MIVATSAACPHVASRHRLDALRGLHMWARDEPRCTSARKRCQRVVVRMVRRVRTAAPRECRGRPRPVREGLQSRVGIESVLEDTCLTRVSTIVRVRRFDERHSDVIRLFVCVGADGLPVPRRELQSLTDQFSKRKM